MVAYTQREAAMNAQTQRTGLIDSVLRNLRDNLHALAEIADDLGEPDTADRLHTAGKMLDGIDRERAVDEFLQAVKTTLGLVEIELDDLIYGEDTDEDTGNTG